MASLSQADRLGASRPTAYILEAIPIVSCFAQTPRAPSVIHSLAGLDPSLARTHSHLYSRARRTAPGGIRHAHNPRPTRPRAPLTQNNESPRQHPAPLQHRRPPKTIRRHALSRNLASHQQPPRMVRRTRHVHLASNAFHVPPPLRRPRAPPPARRTR